MNTTPLLAGRTVTGPAAARLTIDGREYVNFFGSGYLALSGVPEIRGAVLEVLRNGAAFSEQFPSALGATDPVFAGVESQAAVICGTEASVYFASGYLIGMVGLASLADSFDLILVDERAHYSLKDAARLTGLPRFSYEHCNVEALGDILRRHLRPGQRPLVVTDGAFATSGRIPPLADYAAVLARYDGKLFIDESHSFGVVGPRGRGSAEYCGVEHVATCGATLSKAFCAQGALVACSAEAAARLRSTPPIRAACAGSPLSAAAAAASMTFAARHPEFREKIGALTDYFRTRLRSIGLAVIDSPAPIVSFQFGERADMLALQRRLFDRGIHIYYSTYGDAGSNGMIRCAVFRDHTREDIDGLISELG